MNLVSQLWIISFLNTSTRANVQNMNKLMIIKN